MIKKQQLNKKRLKLANELEAMLVKYEGMPVNVVVANPQKLAYLEIMQAKTKELKELNKL